MCRSPHGRGWIAAGLGCLILGFGSFAVSAPGAARASGQAAQIRDELRHDVTVTLKLIQVYVTDRKGRPITDLDSDDFMVYDNGREMTLAAFERHDLVSPPPAGGPAAAEPEADSRPAVTRKFLLFFDFAFNTGKGIEKAMTAALHFLDNQVGPGDEVGVASFSLGRGMKIHEFFTVDHPKARQTVAELKIKDAAGRFESMESLYWAQAMSQAMAPLTAQEAGEIAAATDPTKGDRFRGTPALAESALAHAELKSQVQLYLDRLTDLARALRYVPGQKNLIVFSTGIPQTLFGGTMGLRDRDGYVNNDAHLRTKNEEALRELASANVSFFTFDTREQARPANLFGDDESSFASGLGRNMGATNILNFYSDEKMTGRSMLERYAHETGGRYFGNIRSFERNMEQVHDLTGTFYVLGYSVREDRAGDFHKIRVETTRPDATIHTQAGYYEPKPFTEYSKLEKEMHLFDLALSEKPMTQTPRPAGVLGLAAPAPSGNLLVLSRLSPETVEALSAGPAEIVVFAFDEDGQLVGLVRMVQALSPYRGKPFYAVTPIRLGAGNYTCRVVVRDLQTGAAAVGTAGAAIPKEPVESVRLHTPLLLAWCRVPPAWLEGHDSRASASWTEFYPFETATLAPLAEPVPAGTPSIHAIVPCTIANDVEVGLRAILVDPGAVGRAEVPLVPVAHSQSGDTVSQTYEIPIGKLRPGDYILYFHAEAEGKAVSHAWARFTIR